MLNILIDLVFSEEKRKELEEKHQAYMHNLFIAFILKKTIFYSSVN